MFKKLLANNITPSNKEAGPSLKITDGPEYEADVEEMEAGELF